MRWGMIVFPAIAGRLGLTLFLPLLTSLVPAVLNLLTKIAK